MWPDRVSNPGPPTYESGALPIALRGPAKKKKKKNMNVMQAASPHAKWITNSYFANQIYQIANCEVGIH